MKRIERALDGKTDHHHADRSDQRDTVRPLCVDIRDAVLNIAHQQVSCDIIQNAQSHQQQTRSQRSHDHVARRRLDRPPALCDHDQAARADRVDLHEDIRREKVIRIDQREQ